MEDSSFFSHRCNQNINVSSALNKIVCIFQITFNVLKIMKLYKKCQW